MACSPFILADTRSGVYFSMLGGSPFSWLWSLSRLFGRFYLHMHFRSCSYGVLFSYRLRVAYLVVSIDICMIYIAADGVITVVMQR